MWTRHKQHIGSVDSKIVTQGFLIAENYDSRFGFLDADKNPFKRSINVPMFHVMKVHRRHPINVSSASLGHVHVYPANEHRKKHPRMPMQVYEDRMDYDLASFMLVPFDVSAVWSEQIKITNGFRKTTGGKTGRDPEYTHGTHD